MIYAGGAIDYTTHDPTTSWQHRLPELIGLEPVGGVFCPRCANLGNTDDEAVIRNNARALEDAELALFLLDGTFTVGTPIEIHQRIMLSLNLGTVIIHPNGPPGLYVRVWERQGVRVFKSFGEVGRWLEQQQ